MTAIFRNRAALPTGIREAELRGGGGDGKSPLARHAGPVKERVRYSRDPAAELMPAAEFLGADPDFSAILEDFRDGPFDPRRRRVLGRLMGMFAMDYQGARAEERRFLRRLLAAQNAREGYVANRALHLCGAFNAVRRTLALGVAETRFDEEDPPRGFLGAVQARVAATTFLLLGSRTREDLWNLLTYAGRDDAGKLLAGADAVIERALILKAVGARRHLLGPWSEVGEQTLIEIRRFAEAIRGQPRASLAARTTLRPGDPSCVAPGLEHLDGMQRAGYLARGEIDPVFAWDEHGATHVAASSAAVGADGDIYESLPDLDRSPLADRPRLHQALAEARARDDRLTKVQRDGLTDYFVGREMVGVRTAAKDEALTRLRQGAFDVLNLRSLEAIRQDSQGIYRFDAAYGLGLLLSRYTGAMYVRRVFNDQMTAGTDPLAQIARALEHGMTVPFTVGETRLSVIRAWAALERRVDLGEVVLDLRRPASGDQVELLAQQLIAPQLPKQFGRRARVDAYLAPAALDLLAPPFGIAFKELGIEDVL